MRLTVLPLLVTLCACRGVKDDSRPQTDDTATDTDSAAVDSGDSAVDSGSVDSGDSGETDSGADDSGDPGTSGPPTAQAWCTSAATMTGGGYTAFTCLSPVDLAAGPVSTGGGYVWQAGPAAWMAP